MLSYQSGEREDRARPPETETEFLSHSNSPTDTSHTIPLPTTREAFADYNNYQVLQKPMEFTLFCFDLTFL